MEPIYFLVQTGLLILILSELMKLNGKKDEPAEMVRSVGTNRIRHFYG